MGFFDDLTASFNEKITAQIPLATEYFTNKITQPLLAPKPAAVAPQPVYSPQPVIQSAIPQAAGIGIGAIVLLGLAAFYFLRKK